MHRREFLKTLGMAGTAALLSSCAVRRTTGITPIANCLPRVRVSADRIIRSICGLRPYRRSGFVVRAEKIGDTLLVHNYGHGGAGITLAWGTSKLAVELVAGHARGTAAVIGAGVVGLSTARLLQDAGYSVTIIAKNLPPETTSNVAGGWWSPVSVVDHEYRTPGFDNQFAKACKYSFERYQTMIGERYGVRWTRSYRLADSAFSGTGDFSRSGVVGSLFPEFRDLTPEEHPFSGYKFVRQFDTLLIEPPIYLTRLLEEFRIAGGKIEVRELRDLQEIESVPQKLVFNCTGLGAKALCDDPELTPIKGQLTFLLPQPEVEYSVIPGDLYMFSRRDGVLLGGTHEEGNWSLDVDLQVRDRIVAAHEKFFREMKSC